MDFRVSFRHLMLIATLVALIALPFAAPVKTWGLAPAASEAPSTSLSAHERATHDALLASVLPVFAFGAPVVTSTLAVPPTPAGWILRSLQSVVLRL